MELRIIDEVPTPPASPTSQFIVASSTTANGYARAGSPSLRINGTPGRVQYDAGDHGASSPSPLKARSPRPDRAITSMPSTPSTSTLSTSSSADDQPSLYEPSWFQYARVLIAQTRQAAANALPSSITPPFSSLPHASSRILASASRVVSASLSTTSTSSSPPRPKRELTALAGKDKGREGSEEVSLAAWHQLLIKALNILPSLPSSGPKRVRTRSRRLILLMACIACLCYIFSNALKEAYHYTAVTRREQAIEDHLKEILGPNLQEYLRHPIEDLMENAKRQWNEKIANQSQTPEEGMQEYRRRYKREPPLGYKEWFEDAKGELEFQSPSYAFALKPFLTGIAYQSSWRTFNR